MGLLHSLEWRYYSGIHLLWLVFPVPPFFIYYLRALCELEYVNESVYTNVCMLRGCFMGQSIVLYTYINTLMVLPTTFAPYPFRTS